jgi:hypothetical protein
MPLVFSVALIIYAIPYAISMIVVMEMAYAYI